MHRRVSLLFLVVLFVLFAVACGSTGSGRPANITAPDLRAQLNGSVFFGSGTTAPANIDVTVTNTANVPIVLRRVEVDSPGMGTHGILRTSRTFRENIAPGETKSVTVFATAVTTTRNPSEPLTIRVIADFESGKDRWREIEMR
ncbi:MAG TPA: hypothetical protein VFV49_01270 [Thermoanaerobaculia bacterium]|nr:hypothetical protein [Thermoanaerobaculia bacterium]